MRHILENSQVHLAIESSEGRWSLALRQAAAPLIDSAEWGAAFTLHGRRRYAHAGRPTAQVEAVRTPGPAGETLDGLRVEAALDQTGVALRGEFALHGDHPACLIRLTLINNSPRTIRCDRFIIGRVGPAAMMPAKSPRLFDVFRAPPRAAAPGAMRLDPDPGQMCCYVNGWQSWSFAGALGEEDWQPGPRLGPITVPMHAGAAFPWPQESGHFRSDMFSVLRSPATGNALIFGFLSQREQFGSVETWLHRLSPSVMMAAELDGVLLDPGAHLTSDWACIGLQHTAGEDVFEGYLDLVARENRARITREPPFGWCSWYHYFTRVTDDDLQRNVVAAAQLREQLPLKLIQLDDGFQSDVGDWYKRNVKFPRDMQAVAEGIRAQGFIPGLWLAPLIAKPSAHIVRSKPGWWLRSRWGRPASAGLVWFKWGRGLDTSQPEAIAHAASLIRTAAHEWGFPYLKLDFLYASALEARRADRTVTRAQALRRALEAMRAAAGEETFLLGCGCPLGSGIGIFDAMRIGTDVDFRWHPTLRPISAWIRNDPTYPSARNAIRNTLTRAMLHRRWWWNDPDCLLARDTHTRLNLDERRSLATAIALSGGALLVSDDLTELTQESLRLVQALVPANPHAARVIGWDVDRDPHTAVLACHGALGEWHVVARFNLGESAIRASLDFRELGLPEYAEAFSFWDERYIAPSVGSLALGSIAAHGVCLVAVRAANNAPALVGSTLHFTQGREVSSWRTSAHEVALGLQLGRTGSGSLYLRLPAPPRSAIFKGLPVTCQPSEDGLYRVNVTIPEEGRLEVTW